MCSIHLYQGNESSVLLNCGVKGRGLVVCLKVVCKVGVSGAGLRIRVSDVLMWVNIHVRGVLNGARNNGLSGVKLVEFSVKVKS